MDLSNDDDQLALVLRALPEAPSAETRRRFDLQNFTNFSAHIAEGGRPQPRRDHAVAAAARLHRLERAQAGFDAALAENVIRAGESFGGRYGPGRAAMAEQVEIGHAGSGHHAMMVRCAVTTGLPDRDEHLCGVVAPPTAEGVTSAAAAGTPGHDPALAPRPDHPSARRQVHTETAGSATDRTFHPRPRAAAGPRESQLGI